MLIECQNRERQRPDQRSNFGKAKAHFVSVLIKGHVVAPVATARGTDTQNSIFSAN